MQPTRPFSLLASVYDAIMSDVDYDDWGRFILATVTARGWQGRLALDLGCGTGNSSYPLQRRGLEVIGVDASAEMLAVAQQKYPDIQFLEANFTDFELPWPVDLAVSVFDSLNNLLTPEAFLLTAERVWHHLTPGGAFMFDVNTTPGLRELWEGSRAEGWVGDIYYRWEHSFDEVTQLAKVEAYCTDSERAFTEVHFERPYDPPELRVLLAKAGFTEIEMLSYPDGTPASEEEPRVWVLARKP
ncbi:MAG: methyltransferase domain-containing protein [Truepera sp.]|nr:methyltransferase domain-containing protein [Truepera sp.]